MANRKNMNRTLAVNQIGPRTQVNGTTGNGGSQPPRKRTVAIAHMVRMAMYSPRKNNKKGVAEYSTAYPATSSDSASTRSNGGRLVSASAETKNTTNIGSRGSQNQLNIPPAAQLNSPFSCASTIALRLSEPAHSKTVINTKPIETS